MSNVAKIAVCLLASFATVMVPRGMRITMPEFWLTPWLYGAPLVLLAWPVYFPLFRRLRSAAWWTLPVAGVLVAPLPFFLLVTAESVLGSGASVTRPLTAFLPWNSIFGVWYAAFGAILGAWVGLTRNPRSTASSAEKKPA